MPTTIKEVASFFLIKERLFMVLRKVILIGFMGAGKTYIGNILANHFRLSFVDTDELIEKKSDLSTNEIFLHGGERYFRKLERMVITDLNKEEIVATGAGIIESEINRSWLKEPDNFVIWLNPVWDILLERIKTSDRPKVRSLNPSELHTLWVKRYPLYEECADLIYEKNAPQELFDLLKDKLDSIKIS